MKNGTLEMNDGRVIHLEKLSQTLTYEGWLEGAPTRAMNEQQLADLRAAPPTRYFERACYLVRPPMRSVDHPFAGDVELCWMPRITCQALFVSQERARDLDADMSSLRIIWLQDAFALPIAEPALTKIKAIDWAARAADGWA